MKKRLTRRFDPLPGQPGLKASVWVTQSFLAPRYGLSGLALGQLLTDEGFRENRLPSEESLASGLAKIHQKEVYKKWAPRKAGTRRAHQMKVFAPVSLWHQERLVAALEQKGHYTFSDRAVYVRVLGRQIIKDFKPADRLRREPHWDSWVEIHEKEVEKAKHYIDLVAPQHRLEFLLELRSHLQENGLPDPVIANLFRVGEYSGMLRSHALDKAWGPAAPACARPRF